MKDGDPNTLIINTLDGPITFEAVGLKITSGSDLIPKYGKNGGDRISFWAAHNMNAISQQWKEHEERDYPLREIVPPDANFKPKVLTQCIHRLAAADILHSADLAQTEDELLRTALSNQPRKRLIPSGEPESLKIAKILRYMAQRLTGFRPT